MPVASGEAFDISQAKVITRAKFGDSRPGTEIVSRMLLSFVYNISWRCGLLDDMMEMLTNDPSELLKRNT